MALLVIAGVTHGPNLRDVRWLWQWLLTLPSQIDMHPVGQPVIESYAHWPGGAPSGVLFLEESAITVHTYPERDFLEVVLHSCKPILAWQKTAQVIAESIGLDVRYLHYLGDLNWRVLADTPALGAGV